MLVYISFIILTIFFGLIINNQPLFRMPYIILTVGYLFVITAWRSYSVGSDTINYVSSLGSLASEADYINLLDINTMIHARFEYGFVLLNKLIYIFTDNPRWLLIICSLIVYLSLLMFLSKLSRNISLSLIMFMSLGYMAASMNTIRQSVAVAFIMLSYIFLIQNKKTKFVIMVIVAFFFHKTSILFIVALLLVRLRYTKKSIIIMLLISMIITGIYGKLQNLINSLNYVDIADYNASSGYLGITINIVIVLFLLGISYLAFHNRDVEIWNANFPNKSDQLLPILLVVSIGIFFISLNFSQLVRVATYFEVAALIYIPNALRSIKSKNISLTLTSITYVVMVAYFIIVLVFRPEWTNITPYVWSDYLR